MHEAQNESVPRLGSCFALAKRRGRRTGGKPSAVSLFSLAGAANFARRAGPLGQFDLDVYTRCEIELHKRINRLRGRLNDVQQALVGADLELLP